VSGTTYDEQFTFNQTYHAGQPQYDHWESFRQALSGNSYTGIIVSGSNDPIGLTCNVPASVNQIVSAMHNSTTVNLSCNGHTWYVDTCSSGVGLMVDESGCSCAQAYAVRPTFPDIPSMWGGIAGPTCQAPSQEMKVFVAN
jgi:hypothetical protein